MLNLAVIFGGRSGEHEVSLVSGTTVMSHLNKQKYAVHALGIRRDGTFADSAEVAKMIQEPLTEVTPVSVDVNSGNEGRLIDLVGRTSEEKRVRFDLFFPVLHGPYGEDGTIQGLLEMTGRPYVGCGVAGSAIGMDKELSKRLLAQNGLAVLPWTTVYADEWRDGVINGMNAQELSERWGAAFDQTEHHCFARGRFFVKPCRMGSSVGVVKTASAQELNQALSEALQFDYKVIVEPALEAREFECAVMGNRGIEVTAPGEILPSREFYDYRAKYLDGDASKLLIPAPLNEETGQTMQNMAHKAFGALGGEGFGRVDFLQDTVSGKIYINEINTIPGFTEISMFPKLWLHEGWEMTRLLDHLVDLARERFAWKAELKSNR